jgi:hypothetical protein
VSFGRRGSRCHNSSVTNGINGCRRRNPKSRHEYNVCCADLRIIREEDSSVMGFIASCQECYKSFDDEEDDNERTYDVNITKLV